MYFSFAALMGCVKKNSEFEMHSLSASGKMELAGLTLRPEGGMSDEYIVQYLQQVRAKDWEGFGFAEAKQIFSSSYNDPYINVLLAEYYFQDGSLQQALSLLNQTEGDVPNKIEVDELKSRIYIRMKRYDLALDHINNAILVNRKDPGLFGTKADIYMAMEDSLSALRYYQQVWDIDSLNQEVAIKIASIYAARHQADTAIAWLNRADVDDESSDMLDEVKIRIFRETGQDAKANELLYGRIQQGDFGAGDELMRYYLNESQYDSTLKVASKILELDSANLNAMLRKGEVFDRRGYYPSALQYYGRVLQIDSLNEEAQEGMRKVNGKIAYLRKIRAEKASIPIFDFASPNNQKTED